MWVSVDADLVEFGNQELERIRLVKPSEVEAGYVVRMPKAYPVYDETSRANVDTIWEAWRLVSTIDVSWLGREIYDLAVLPENVCPLTSDETLTPETTAVAEASGTWRPPA